MLLLIYKQKDVVSKQLNLLILIQNLAYIVRIDCLLIKIQKNEYLERKYIRC